MFSTPITLLERLRMPEPGEAWERFVRLYTPFLLSIARRTCANAADAADLVQEVFLILVRKLPEFEYDRSKSFRSWLRTVTVNKWREKSRKPSIPMATGTEGSPDPEAADEFEVLWEEEYRKEIVGTALRLMRGEFQESTWKACLESIVGDRPITAVAAELGMTPGAVRAAKFRVLTRLRQELEGLLD